MAQKEAIVTQALTDFYSKIRGPQMTAHKANLARHLFFVWTTA